MKFSTRLLHDGTRKEKKTGATNTPIYQSSAFEQDTAEQLENIFSGQEPGFFYTRVNNPTVAAFEKRLALIEGGVSGLACNSGMAAVTIAVLAIASHGDEIISGGTLFGGTHSLFENLRNFGIVCNYAKDADVNSFRQLITEKTKLIFVESISNPELSVVNIKELSALAKEHDIPLIVDSTVSTPYLFNPIAHGADVVVHSTSKYINGNGNAIGGVIVDAGTFQWNLEKHPSFKEYEQFGKMMYTVKMRKNFFKDIGVSMPPFHAFLNSIGLDTLSVRMDKICSNALQLAEHLHQHSNVVSMNYPGLKDNPYYNVSKTQFDGQFGGILTIRVGSKENAYKVINALQFVVRTPNIGDTRTLVIHPWSTIYSSNTPEEKEMMGVYEDLIRVSVGLEDIEDLMDDFTNALDKLSDN